MTCGIAVREILCGRDDASEERQTRKTEVRGKNKLKHNIDMMEEE